MSERLEKRDRNGRVSLAGGKKADAQRTGKGGKEESLVLAPWVLLQDRIASSLAL